ncbi:hypothetical protein ASD47_08195 [Caulobacter sp. Root1472]|nr:hypothetical protein ASD47_08195 [Caulobacter sp. Root1472]
MDDEVSAATRTLESMKRDTAFDLIDSANALPAPDGLALVLHAARMAPEIGEIYAAAADQMPADSDEALLLWLAAKGMAFMLARSRLEELDGHAWDHLDCRPFIRASIGYARCCFRRGEHDTAITELEQLLKYDRADHAGVRYLLAVILLAAPRFKRFESLRGEFTSDGKAFWLWLDAYHAIRTNRRSAERKACVDRALEANPHVLPLLNSDQALNERKVEYYQIGSFEEAYAFAASEGGRLWRMDWRTLGALNRHRRS